MKIRTGFVSNSSSSSFICDVCGEDVSGMDMCLSEAGMFKCVNDHTCCDSHQLTGVSEPTIEEKRKFLIAKLDAGSNIKWYSERPDEKIQRISYYTTMSGENIDEHYQEAIDDSGKPECNCPICQFKNMDKPLVLKMLIKKSGISEKELLDNLKRQFTTFVEFKKYIE